VGFTAAFPAGWQSRVRAKTISCGVIVTDGRRLLLGHATRSPRWDIPKGVADPAEELVAAARRELFEETGLEAPQSELRPLGVFPYLSGKDLALFCWAPHSMPDPKTLICASCFSFKGSMLPEFDRFGLFAKEEALQRVGKSLAALLTGISLESLCNASG
jgi:putative (di)nucleoside polyphosphate hydrolase